MSYSKNILQKLISNLGFSKKKDPIESKQVITQTEEENNTNPNEYNYPNTSRKLGPSYSNGQGGANGGASDY